MSTCAVVRSFIESKTTEVQTSNVGFTSEVSDYFVVHTGPGGGAQGRRKGGGGRGDEDGGGVEEGGGEGQAREDLHPHTSSRTKHGGISPAPFSSQCPPPAHISGRQAAVTGW